MNREKLVEHIKWRLDRDKHLLDAHDPEEYDHDTHMKIFWYGKGHLEGVQLVLDMIEHPELFFIE